MTGHSSFDVLVQWSPLYLIAEVRTSFCANVFGVGVFSLDIDVAVEGPTPWHIHGHGSISLLFFSVSVPIDKTIGEVHDTSLPPIAVLPMIAAELGKSANWKAALPAGSNLLVTLRKLDGADSTTVLHPVGTLQVSQRAVPLELTIDKVGAQRPADANRFSLAVTSSGLAKSDDLTEPFAPAQFQDMSDAAKLSQPAYAPLHSGVELAASAAAYASGTAISPQMRYSLTVVDTQYRRFQRQFFPFVKSLFAHFLGGSSVTLNAFSAATAQSMQPKTEKISAVAETFTAANQSDNRAYGASLKIFSSQVAAQDYIDHIVSADPMLAGTLHVLPQFEVTP